jgi:hypothetical protein
MEQETEQKPGVSVEPKNEEPKVEPVGPAPKLFRVYGREFDVSTETGFIQAQAFAEGMSTLIGKQSTEIGTLRKEVEPLRKYNLTNASVDEVKILKDVEKLRDEGRHSDADRLMFELYRQTQNVADERLEKERLWNDYRAANSKMFEVLDEEMSKEHVFKNYSSELSKTEDQFGLLDRVLKPKFNKFNKSSDSVNLPPATVGANQGTKTLSKPVSDTPKADDKGAWDKTLEEMGFK